MFHCSRQCVIGNFKLSTLNVNGLSSPIKRGKMIAKAKKEKSQIVFFGKKRT